ncbi:MAG TPA: cation diffusion facilitator family transporter [Thermotogota bacterium]|nr:cation diffusion facilitator family transporter [Thermotogota bacterium]HRW34329.1 cation diffusion facilitator family transporter [Thermotogota bacterium]
MNQENHDHSHHHTHHHDVSELSGKKIFWVTLLNATITIAEFIGGLVSGSLALLSDSIHNLSDTLAIAFSYVAHRISLRPKNSKKTFGYKRAEIIAAFVNASVLFAVSGMLIIEAFKRFANPEPIDGTLMMTVAIIGLSANLFSVLLLHKDSKGNLNIKSSYLHLLNDTISSVGVVVGGVAINLWGITWIDPVITLLISGYILRETFLIIKKTVDILMQSSPDVDYEQIKKDVESIPGIVNLHHVHAWMINEQSIYFEAHVDMENIKLCEAEKITQEIERLLKTKYSFSHTTIQAEVNRCENKNLFA